MLEINHVHTHYGNIHILKGISLAVERGEIVALLGSNGAGKTTLLKTISGLLRPTSGEIVLEGVAIHNRPTHELARMGLAHVPEGRRIFARLRTIENLHLGAFARRDRSRIAPEVQEILRRFPILRERSEQIAGTLSGGEQQMLAIARALMSRPKILLLDEPSLGLAPKMVQTVFEIIQEINRQGVTILLVEQNAHMALEIAHRAYVLETGHITLEGTGHELLGHPMVKEAYLGG